MHDAITKSLPSHLPSVCYVHVTRMFHPSTITTTQLEYYVRINQLHVPQCMNHSPIRYPLISPRSVTFTLHVRYMHVTTSSPPLYPHFMIVNMNTANGQSVFRVTLACAPVPHVSTIPFSVILIFLGNYWVKSILIMLNLQRQKSDKFL